MRITFFSIDDRQASRMMPLPDHAPVLTSLVAVQFLLYAAGWWLCAALIRADRAAIGHWGAFMALIGLTLFSTTSGIPAPPGVAETASSLLLLAAFVVLRRGLERFLDAPTADREHLFVLFAAGMAQLALGPVAETGLWRHAVLYLAFAWVLARAGLALWRALDAHYRRPMAILLTAVPSLLAILFAGLLAAQVSLDSAPGQDLGLAPALADIIGAALFNAAFLALVCGRLLHRIREGSHQDELTGLANRRRLDCLLPVEWQRLQRGGTEFCLLHVDIDRLRDLNDRYGRNAGDRLLAELAQRLRYTAREIDLVARTDGGEFLVMTPQTCVDGAYAAAERLRNAVNAMPFTVGGNPVTLSVSIGVAVAKHSDLDLSDVFERASSALARAKAGGRNRVCLEDA